MIGLVFTLIIMTGSIYLIIEGNKKDDSAEFYGGSDDLIYLFDVFSNTKYKKYRKYGENIQIQET